MFSLFIKGDKYVFGGYARDARTRFESTSGGAFSAIVDAYCQENYVIFGAEANGLEVLIRILNLVSYLLYGYGMVSLDVFVVLFCSSYAVATVVNFCIWMIC